MKKNKLKNDIIYRKRQSKFLLLLLAFFSGILFIFYSYAWFSSSLDVKIQFFDMTVSSNNGLFISLDGIDFSDTVEISKKTIIDELKDRYPANTNQWASGGLWPISTVGINNSNENRFDLYAGAILKKRDENRIMRKHLNTIKIYENTSTAYTSFVAFDIFLKNVSGSPLTDNLFISEGTYIDFDKDVEEETKDEMQGLLNSIRFGFLFMDYTNNYDTVENIQALSCNNKCFHVIYEPNSLAHTSLSIERAMKDFNVSLIDGIYKKTYAIVDVGRELQYANGHPETGIALDTKHFREQITIKDEDLSTHVYEIPNGITKVRVYVWIEGQDIDSLETNSEGAPLNLAIDFEKDLAGYR